MGFGIKFYFFKLTLDVFLEVIIDVKHRFSVTPDNRIPFAPSQTSSHFFEYFFTSPQPLIALAILPTQRLLWQPSHHITHKTSTHTITQPPFSTLPIQNVPHSSKTYCVWYTQNIYIKYTKNHPCCCCCCFSFRTIPNLNTSQTSTRL